MHFTKMHGLGNDFIVIYGEKKLPLKAPELARKWCDRHFGMGADGLVFLLPSETADMTMRIINSDGTEAEQCGNAIRCAAKYLFDKGIVPKTDMTIQTIGGGIQPVTVYTKDHTVTAVRVDMGKPILEPSLIPIAINSEQAVDLPIEVDGVVFRFTGVSMGNPHCVIFVEDAESFDYGSWGPKLERHSLFPNKTNVEFVTVKSREHILMRVWERGAGPTLACGTGACATLVASVLNGHSGRTAVVSLTGGDLAIEWNTDNDHVYMTGPAAVVFEGTIEGIA